MLLLFEIFICSFFGFRFVLFIQYGNVVVASMNSQADRGTYLLTN